MTNRLRNFATGAVLLLAPALANAQLFTLTKEQLIELTSQSTFDRFPDGRPKIPADLLERARGMSAEEVWAGLNQAGLAHNPYGWVQDDSAPKINRCRAAGGSSAHCSAVTRLSLIGGGHGAVLEAAAATAAKMQPRCLLPDRG